MAEEKSDIYFSVSSLSNILFCFDNLLCALLKKDEANWGQA